VNTHHDPANTLDLGLCSLQAYEKHISFAWKLLS
jgi:hypothetical protein